MNILPNKDISHLCLELSMLFRAGILPGDGLSLLAEESEGEFKKLFSDMSKKIYSGASLAEVFDRAGCFPDYVCRLIEVGEQTGKTEEVLSSLSQYYDNRDRLNRRIRQALLYPALLLILMLIVIGILLVKVLPIFNDVYSSLGGQITGIAGGLLTVGKWLDKIMPVIWCILALSALLAAVIFFIKPLRNKASALWNRLCGDRGISRRINDSRIAQSLSLYISSGMTAEEALTKTAEHLNNSYAKKRCLDCCKLLENGEPTYEALRKTELLPAASCRLIDIGQKSGSTDTAMKKIADDLSNSADDALEETVGRIEPALVLICSILVGLILLSVMLPLMHIMSAIG